METGFVQGSKKDANELIKNNMGFIIKTVGSVTHRYVSVENDETLSIGMMGFAEAVEKYDESRGNFLGFAKLVIESRLKSYLLKENKHNNESLEEIIEKNGEIVLKSNETDNMDIFQEEIELLKNELLYYGLTFDMLVKCAPKHRDTRKSAVSLADKISDDEYMLGEIHRKKRLPIKEVCLRFVATEKFVKRNKNFILTVVIVFNKKLKALSMWIREAVK